MSDSLYVGKRFRTFNVIDDFNRELLHIEIVTSITGKRLILVFEPLHDERGLPKTLCTDNGPEFLLREFVAWNVHTTPLMDFPHRYFCLLT